MTMIQIVSKEESSSRCRWLLHPTTTTTTTTTKTATTTTNNDRRSTTTTTRHYYHKSSIGFFFTLLSVAVLLSSSLPTTSSFLVPSSSTTSLSLSHFHEIFQRQSTTNPLQSAVLQQRQRSSQHLQNTDTTLTSTSTRLYSLQPLVDSIIEKSSNRNGKKKQQPLTIFVGGKGGVGKTTVSSALAVHLASLLAEDLNVLIVSTDPAHSLGDALDVNLRVNTPNNNNNNKGNKKNIITLTDPVTCGKLHAMEIDAVSALQEFRDSLSAFDIERLATTLGVNVEFLEGLGLREFTGLLNNPPPGLDELVALGNIFNTNQDIDDSGSTNEEYDVVIVDTAPTGHTLRLLSLPQFLTGFLSKLLSLRKKLSGIAATLQSFLGGGDAARQRTETMDQAINKLEVFQQRISNLQQQLTNKDITTFLVVTVPTKLAVSESKRLVKELQLQNINVNHIVVNQCIINNNNEGTLRFWTFPHSKIFEFFFVLYCPPPKKKTKSTFLC